MPESYAEQTKSKGEDEEEPARIDELENLTLQTPQQGATLLPAPAAALVSGITGISSFSLRAGTKIGGWWLYAGREATLKTLSVSRSALEAVLFAAGHDVASRGNGGLGELEAMNILETSISALHSTISTISFVASTGFYLTEASMNSISGLSIQGLATLNAILGSTESSRAVAAIITLIRNELKKPDPGSQGEVVSNIDLIYGTIGFVFLQRWGRRKTELDFRDAGGEESIWDTVIDDKGFRADVVGTRKKETVNFLPRSASTMPFASPIDDDDLEVLERGTLYGAQAVTLTPEDQTQLSDEEIRESIMQQLPHGARAVITSETITAKTIKVEIFDTETAHIEAPPGTIMVAERLNHEQRNRSDSRMGPNQTVIFRTALNRSSSAEIDPYDQLRFTEEPSVEKNSEALDNDELFMMKSSKRLSGRSDANLRFEDSPLEEPGGARFNFEWPTSNSKSAGPIANEKKSRRPVPSATTSLNGPNGPVGSQTSKASKGKSHSNNKSEKHGVLKKALRTLSPSQSSTAVKDASNSNSNKKKPPSKPLPDLPSRVMIANSRDTYPRNSHHVASMSNGHTPVVSPTMNMHQPNSTSGYFSVHESRRDSTLSQTETYSIHSIESRPGSPTFTRTQTRVLNGLTQTKSEVGLALKTPEARPESSGGTLHSHHRSRSFLPSLYSMATKDSGEAIILAPKMPTHRKSIYEDHRILHALMSEGKVPGIFPDRHMAKTIRRFSKFATASYGSGFLHVMGLTTAEKSMSKSTELMGLDVPQEHSSFSSHTGLPSDTILLSSFFDPNGVTGNTDLSAAAISPLIHFISIDHDSKAVVLTCRGTLGFEDVLTDMTCDYDDLVYQGHPYKVHKGIHASARRMLGGTGSRVMATIKATLEEFSEYGLVLCGHSLGGAVSALVAILISEPCHDESKASFVTGTTQKFLTDASSHASTKDYIPPISLPTGRPIHVYAFGSPATISEPLRLATRGLITTIVNHADIVPSLSLGILHDFRTVALHLKHDTSTAIELLKPRLWQRLKTGLNKAAFGDKGPPPPENVAGDGLGEDTWAWTALKTLRAAMVNDKLVPPGEVFIVETSRVFDRLDPDVAREAVFGPDYNKDDRSEKLYRALGRPATRVQFKHVKDVETRFGELRFGRDMFSDHSPGRYEAALSLLEKGICED